MSEKAKIIDLKRAETAPQRLELDSGRQIVVHVNADEEGELVELVEPQGEVVLRVQLTDDGPVIRAEGARLELKAAETLSLEAKKVKIKATEEATLQSEGTLAVESTDKMDVRSDDDLRMVGKMIYIN